METWRLGKSSEVWLHEKGAADLADSEDLFHMFFFTMFWIE